MGQIRPANFFLRLLPAAVLLLWLLVWLAYLIVIVTMTDSDSQIVIVIFIVIVIVILINMKLEYYKYSQLQVLRCTPGVR